MQRYTVYFIWKLLYMFRVVPPPIIRSANNCIYSIWYLLHRYCYLPSSNGVTNTREIEGGGLLRFPGIEKTKIIYAFSMVEPLFNHLIYNMK